MSAIRPWSAAQRPARLIRKEPNGALEIDNVRWGFQETPTLEGWKPVFAPTTIDPSQVQDVYVTVEPFKPEVVAGHCRLYFKMKQPLQGPNGEQDSGITVSFEARLHQGEQYNPIQGLGKHFRAVYQLGTWKDALQRKTRRYGNAVIRYKLALSPEQKQQLLQNCLNESVEDHSGEWYNTATNSCYIKVLEMLNAVLPPEQQIPAWKLDGRLNPFMLDIRNAPSVLLNHHLLASPDAVLTEPEVDRYPDKQHHPSKLAAALGRLPGIRPALRLGLGAAAAVAAFPIGPIGMVAGAALGQWCGRGIGNLLVLDAHLTTEPSEKYFP
ncbi:MAG: lipoprotein N-acyltransferase Lnb domain-containing protein [Candidatus Xenobia bacterium]